MSDRPPELSARGDRVHVRTVRLDDLEPYRRAVLASADRLREWNPVNPDDLQRHIVAQSPDYRTFMVLANEPEGAQPIVGRVNLTNAVRGRFRSVAMGYDAYDPYAGRGLFGAGLRLVLDLAFAEPGEGGMGLHRVEANVQPGNVTSAGLLRSLGFRHEGFSPRYLYLADRDGVDAWRGHDRYAVTSEEWPAVPYAEAEPRRVLVWLGGGDTTAGQDLGRRLAQGLVLPLLRAGRPDLVDGLADSPGGAVVLAPDGQELPASLAAGETAVVRLSLTELAMTHGVNPDDGWTARTVERVVLTVRAARSAGHP
jgi:[ribosomal protein S5]-alanine N-acetyltransferase